MKLGRNVVAFQRIEKQLKLLVFWSKIESNGPDLEKSLEKNLAKRTKLLRKHSMGKLADEYHENVLDHDPIDTEPIDPSNISISTFCTVHWDDNCAKQKKRELNALITERNNLIHGDVDLLDPCSEESCRTLIAKLDDQYTRIQRQAKEFQSILNAGEQARRSLASILASDADRAALHAAWTQSTRPHSKVPPPARQTVT